MKHLSVFVLALVLSTGAAMAQGSGGGGAGGGAGGSGGAAGGAAGSGSGSTGGGTESNSTGVTTGKDASSRPTQVDCAASYKAGSRWSQSEFQAACK